MNKNDLIASVADEIKLSKKDTAVIVNAVFDAIGDALVAGDKVYYAAWAGGTFNITYDLVGGSFTSTVGRSTMQSLARKPLEGFLK